MKITSFEVITIEIPMRMSVEHTLAKRTRARNVLVKVSGDGGEVGWGECCPREYVTGESVESVREDLARKLLPRLVGRELADLAEAEAHLLQLLSDVPRSGQAAFCAAELAVLDLAGRGTGVSAGDVLGPVATEKVRYSGVIATEDLDTIREQCALMRKFAVGHVKVKVGASLDGNLRILELARETLGPDVGLRLDANAAWDGPETVRQLEAMSAFRIQGVEQPVPAEDLEGMRHATAAAIVPVVADESLCSLEDARQLAATRGCDVFNVRISKCGGLINAGRIQAVAHESGLRCQLGAQVGETGILSAAGRHFATRHEPLWCEGSYGSLLLEEDLTDPDVTLGPGGFAPALPGPGLGVSVLSERVAAHTVDTIRVS